MFNLEHLLKVMDPEPILVDHQACLAARHRQSTCRSCITACPAEALSAQEGKVVVDSARCVRCGLCAGGCPTGAITVRGVDDGAPAEADAVRCSRSKGTGVQVPCLGYLTVDHFLAMSIRHKHATVTRADCATCPWKAGGEAAAQRLEIAQQALAALGEEGFITLRSPGQGAAGQPGSGQPGSGQPSSGQEKTVPISRRELFNLWRVESVQVARQFAPEREINHAKLPARLPKRRSRWVRQVSPDGPSTGTAMPAGPWKALRVNESCIGCSVCTSFCPTGALEAHTEGQNWVLTHQPAACIACGTCSGLCPTHAFAEEPLEAQAMRTGDRRELAHLTTLDCSSCHREFKGRPGVTQCPQCQSLFGFLEK